MEIEGTESQQLGVNPYRWQWFKAFLFGILWIIFICMGSSYEAANHNVSQNDTNINIMMMHDRSERSVKAHESYLLLFSFA